MRIDYSPKGAVTIRVDLKHCYVLIFFIFGTGFFFGLDFFLLFFPFFLVVYLDFR